MGDVTKAGCNERKEGSTRDSLSLIRNCVDKTNRFNQVVYASRSRSGAVFRFCIIKNRSLHEVASQIGQYRELTGSQCDLPVLASKGQLSIRRWGYHEERAVTMRKIK